jgi:hypothetical protein
MCFSAEASFGASAVLIAVGIYCTTVAARKDPAYLPLAAAPVVFGVQQFLEGLVWKGLQQQNERLMAMASLGFLFFALVFWPAWAPFCAAVIEPGRLLKGWLALVSLLALIGGLVMYIPLVIHASMCLETGISRHSIQYRFQTQRVFSGIPQGVWQLLYVLAIAAPLGVTANRRFSAFSLLSVAAAIISHVFYWYAYTSVWCFFAAILLLYLCYLFQGLPESTLTRSPVVAPTGSLLDQGGSGTRSG